MRYFSRSVKANGQPYPNTNPEILSRARLWHDGLRVRHWKGKKFRALDVFGKDLELLRAISDPIFDVSAVTNKDLQNKLKNTSWAKGMSNKQLSGRISRHLLLLRKHGLIKKLPNQRRYSLTPKGQKISSAVSAALAASVEDLLKRAA